MIVSLDSFGSILELLKEHKTLSFDTETTGLYPYKGDRLFSLIIGTSKEEAYYFNFNAMEDIEPKYVLNKSHLLELKKLFEMPDKIWIGHNAKFDMHMLGIEGIEIKGLVHCTMITARLIYNVHDSYSLASCAERIGYKKDDAVEEYIKKNHLWEWQQVPGIKKRVKNKFYNKVPFSIIAPYGETDAKVTYALAEYQFKELERLSGPQGIRAEGSTVPPVTNVYNNECELLKVTYNMERQGAKVDVAFCEEGIKHNEARAKELLKRIETIYGGPYKDTEKYNIKLFEDQKDKWEKSEKGKWSFKKDVIKYFTSEAAELLRQYREAKFNATFFHQVLWFMDSDGILHPNLNQSGTDTGRFSSNEPNAQNLKNDENMKSTDPRFPWRPRKAIVVPDDNYEIISLDYKAQEFILALDYGRQQDIIDQVKNGLDVHLATAYNMGKAKPEDSADSKAKARKLAKTLNFALLYSVGKTKFAKMLNIDTLEASSIMNLYYEKVAGVSSFSSACKGKAFNRGFVINWLGRLLWYPERYSKKKKAIVQTSYKATNGLIQGGAADITKVAMVKIAKLLLGTKSRMFISLHDEIDIYLHKDDSGLLDTIKNIMETVYPGKLVGMQVSIARGNKNWGDLEEK